MPLPPPAPGPSEETLLRRRRITYAVIGVGIAAVTFFHARDAHQRGESIWPGLSVLPVLGLVLFLTTRFLGKPVEGMAPAEARAHRAQQLMRRTAPLAVACLLLVAVLRGCAGR